MKLNAEEVRKEAEAEIRKEARDEAKKKLVGLYRRKAAAEEVVKHVEREIAVALAEIGEGA